MVLADAGLTDLYIANQIVGPIKLKRLAELARRASVRVCVDAPENVTQMGAAARAAGVTLGVLVEVDIGMNRCGVPPGGQALELARQIQGHVRSALRRPAGLRRPPAVACHDADERRRQSLAGTEALVGTRRLIERAGIPVGSRHRRPAPAPGSTSAAAKGSRKSSPARSSSWTARTTRCGRSSAAPCRSWPRVISKRPEHYVLDAGSKAISKDSACPPSRAGPKRRSHRLSEEHTRVETQAGSIHVGDRREVIPAHCCATMNLHRNCIAVRKGKVEPSGLSKPAAGID